MSEAVVSSVNTVATKTVEEAENIVVTTGVVCKVSPARVLSLGSPATADNSALVSTWVNSIRHCVTLQAVPTARWGDLLPLHPFMFRLLIALQEWGLAIQMHKESDTQSIPLACKKYILQGSAW